MTILDETRRYWDDDAATYDAALEHRPRSPMVRAAWRAALERALPPAPARILDCGAGTGFLSLIAAQLGHRVTALDLSTAMLARLADRAGAEGVEVDTVTGDVTSAPGTFDAVMERHVLWTLGDPGAALAAWRAAVRPGGRLVLIESLWGASDPLERTRAGLRRTLRSFRKMPPEHHGPYPAQLRAALPLGAGTPPSTLVTMVEHAGWACPRLLRLRDVEWAERSELPFPERVVGVTPRFAVVSG